MAVSYGSVTWLRGHADGKARRDAQLILTHTGAIECLVGAACVASFHSRQSSAMMRHADDVTLAPPGPPIAPPRQEHIPHPPGAEAVPWERRERMAWRHKPSAQTPRSRWNLNDYHTAFAATSKAQIEQGVAPWQTSWTPGARRRPANLQTGTPYRGSNAVYLSVTQTAKGYRDHRWATYKQIHDMGGQVRTGEPATHVLLYKFDDQQEKAGAADTPATSPAGAAEPDQTRPPMVGRLRRVQRRTSGPRDTRPARRPGQRARKVSQPAVEQRLGPAVAIGARHSRVNRCLSDRLDAVFHPDRDRLAEPFDRPVLVVTDLHAEPVLAPLQLHLHAVRTVAKMGPGVRGRDDLAGRQALGVVAEVVVPEPFPWAGGVFRHRADLEVLHPERQPERYLGRVIGFIRGSHEEHPRRRHGRGIGRRRHLVARASHTLSGPGRAPPPARTTAPAVRHQDGEEQDGRRAVLRWLVEHRQR